MLWGFCVLMLNSRLKTIARRLEEGLDDALKQVADDIAAGARSRVPVDSGDLKASIRVDKRGDGEYAIVAGDGDAYYARLVEQGTVKRPATPYLQPAVEAERDNLDNAVRRHMGKL